ncbi:MAG TPA: MMPL family transporter [Gillisia sp.]|nr:MMPL family transporter [Gillisia sp.]
MFKFHKFLSQNKLPALLGLIIFIGIAGFLASRITLEEDISNLIPAGERQSVIRKVLDNTEFSDKIIVSISSQTETPNPDELTAYAQQFLDSVEKQLPQYINDIQGKVPEEGIREIYNFVYQNLPLFLNESDYNILASRLDRDSIRERMSVNYKNLISPTGLVTKEFLFKDPLSLTGMGLRKLEELQVQDDFELYNNFLITKDQRSVLLFISPALPASETNENLYFIQQLEKIQQELNEEYEGVKGDFFGGVLYSIANANQIKRDIKITLGIAGSILLLLLIFYYKKIYIPLVIFIPSLLGGLTAIAFIYILKGSISAISLGIGAVLLGISIDYSLHILTHYKNNIDVKKLYKDITYPVLMSSTTTAIAFLCLLFLKSEALNDLGLFAAVSVVTASVFALILIPLLYKAPIQEVAKITIIDRIASIDLHRKIPLVVALFIIFVIGLFFFSGVEFNNDLSALNYEPKEIKDREENVREIAGRASKSVYVISYGNSVDEALGHNNELYQELGNMESQGVINTFSSIGGVVLSTTTQLERIERLKEFWTPQRTEQVEEDLVELSSVYGLMPHSLQSFYSILLKDFEPLYLED